MHMMVDRVGANTKPVKHIITLCIEN
jgi:hypothetical protein